VRFRKYFVRKYLQNYAARVFCVLAAFFRKKNGDRWGKYRVGFEVKYQNMRGNTGKTQCCGKYGPHHPSPGMPFEKISEDE